MTSVVCKPLTRAQKYQDDPQWLQVLPLIDSSWAMMAQLLQSVDGKFHQAKVLQWKKKYESAKEKSSRKNVPYGQINDLLKGVVLTENLQQTIAVANFILNHSNVVKWEVKVGDNPLKPYRGVIHIDVRLGNLTCEIQVMPYSTWKVKRLTNASYKTGNASNDGAIWSTVENFSASQRLLLGV
jgi:hypothetical protein